MNKDVKSLVYAPRPGQQPALSRACPRFATRERLDQVAQALVLILLYSVPSLVVLHAHAVGDPDIWWHLRTGEWICTHRAVPHTDPFSSLGMGKPWAAYSWLFEVLMFGLMQHLGIAGIVAYTAGLLLLLTVSLHHLIRRQQADFSLGVLLTFLLCFSCGHLFSPRPWLLTILFFVIELDVLLHARKTGHLRELLYLPLLFALWANIHIQFVNGLVVLAAACAESFAAGRWASLPTRIPPLRLLAVTAASVAATCCNPYGWHIFGVAHDLAAQPGVLNKVQEMQAMPFRDLPDWCVLALMVGAAVLLARSPRFLPLETGLLALSCVLAFRSQRDLWILVVLAGAILSSCLEAGQSAPQRISIRFTPALAAFSGLLLLVSFCLMHLDGTRLEAQLARELPVQAVKFVRGQGYTGPVYNDYAWGGYLIWSLRQPVSIDGRAALHGDRQMDRFLSTWSGKPGWASDPDLQKAQFVIGSTEAPLTQLLRVTPAFRLVYEDQVACVFLRRQP